MISRKIPVYVWIAFIAVFLLSGYSIRKRTEVEAENRSVAIAVEFETIEALAGGQKTPIESALERSKIAGLRALVINEDTIAELISGGRLSIVAHAPNATNASGIWLKFNDPSVFQQVAKGLNIRFGISVPALDATNVLPLPTLTASQLRATPVGLDPRQVALAKRAGLEIIARFANTPGESADSVQQTLLWAKQDGASVFLPLGDEVLGFRTAIDNTLDDLRTDGLLYASPEFAKIAGDTQLVEKGKDIVIRLHGAQIAELDKLTPFDAQDRYVKAARERGMRILLLRPLSLASPQPMTDFDEFLNGIAKQIIKNGQDLGPPHASREPGISKFFFPVLGLSLTPVIWFVASGFTDDRRVRMAGAILLVLAGLSSPKKIGQEFIALLGSLSFPILAFYTLDSVLPRLGKSELIRIIGGFWLVCGISVMGGVCVAGMLNNLAFYIHAAEFQAVKVSVFLPIVVVGLHYFMKLTDWRKSMRSPMTWGSTAMGLGLGLVLAIMIARTGNDTGVGPSGGELVFRSLLDRFLYVRPRTKEFLVGHPMLIVGIGLLSRLFSRVSRGDEEIVGSPYAGWTVLALMVGAIGQTSVVNTLCHIHIPFFLSLARDVEGMALGCIIGVALWLVIKRWIPNGD